MDISKIKIGLLICIFGWLSCSKKEPQEMPDEQWVSGADMSFLPSMEQKGVAFFDANYRAGDALAILKRAGVNTIRIKVWHSPATDLASWDEVTALAARVHQAGMKVLLCIHYSDTWADPGAQSKPEPWRTLSAELLRDSMIDYTRRLVLAVRPEIVQIGNEINNGMLWPNARYPQQSSYFLDLLSSGAAVVRQVAPECMIMLHYAGFQGLSSFVSATGNIDYDMLGVSYYPFWHGTDLKAAEQLLKEIKDNSQKEVMIVETSYPFTLQWGDNTTNIIGSVDQIHPDYPPTPQGQRQFIADFGKMGKRIGLKGICYWGAAWVSVEGTSSADGSTWENQTLFDFSKRLLPAAEALSNR
jgi:arabinogalactan endo-1,4-beta-galactosidase